MVGRPERCVLLAAIGGVENSTLFVARPCVPAVTGCGNPCSIVWGNAWMVCVVWIFFAGSGALGLEAASRGAGAVTLVEKTAAQPGLSAKRRFFWVLRKYGC